MATEGQCTFTYIVYCSKYWKHRIFQGKKLCRKSFCIQANLIWDVNLTKARKWGMCCMNTLVRRGGTCKNSVCTFVCHSPSVKLIVLFLSLSYWKKIRTFSRLREFGDIQKHTIWYATAFVFRFVVPMTTNIWHIPSSF